MDETYSTRELEWFDIETKMRELMQQQLEPVLAKAREDRENNSRLKSLAAQLEKRIKGLEIAVLGDQPLETVIENIMNMHSELEGNRKKDVIRLEQETSGIKESIKSFQFQLSSFQDMLNNFDDVSKNMNGEILAIKENVDVNQRMIIGEINGVNSRFQEMTQAYIDYNLKCEEKATKAYNKSINNKLEINNIKKDIDGLKSENTSLLNLIGELQRDKQTIKDFNTEKSLFEAKIDRIHLDLDTINDDVLKRDSFVDKYLPLKIATFVSDYMHNCLDMMSKKRLAEFEMGFLKDLNTETLLDKEIDSRETQVTKILESMKHVEQRKVELISEKKQKRNDSALDSQNSLSDLVSPQSPKHNQNEPEKITILAQIEEEAPAASLQYGISIENVQEMISKVFEDQFEPHIIKFRFEIKERFANMQKIVKIGDDQSMALAQHLIEEIEDLNKNLKKDKSDSLVSISELKKESAEIVKHLERYDNSLSSTAQMVVCLVECAQIQQALEAQDEEDRHSMAQNFERDLQNELVLGKPKFSPEPYSSTVPSANFSFQKKCLGCGNATSILSGFRTSLMYKPTPLFYRNKKLDRPELITLKGGIIKRCWDSVSNSMP